MEAVPICLLLTFLIGGIQAVLKMLWQGNLVRRLSYLKKYMTECFLEGHMRPYGQSLKEEEAVIHLSAAILFATLIYLMIGGGL